MKKQVWPQLQVKRGVDEVRAIVAGLYDGHIPLPEVAYGISDIDMLERLFPEFMFTSAFSPRLEAGVRSRSVYTSSSGRVYGRSDHLLLRESRFLPRQAILPWVDTTIVGDTVVVVREADGSAVAKVSTDPDFARQMRRRFEILWSQGRP
jgi:hypothetical protein